MSWADIIAVTDADTADDTSASVSPVQITADAVTDQWTRLARGFIVFDGSSIVGATVNSVTLTVTGTEKADTGSFAPDINVYSSSPASNTALATTDFDNVGSTAFSTAISYAGFNDAGTNDFVLNASGIAAVQTAIDGSGIIKLSLRNANYDVAASSPTWFISGTAYLKIAFADTADTTSDPKLVIDYTEPTTTSTSSTSSSTSISTSTSVSTSTSISTSSTSSSTSTSISTSQSTSTSISTSSTSSSTSTSSTSSSTSTSSTSSSTSFSTSTTFLDVAYLPRATIRDIRIR